MLIRIEGSDLPGRTLSSFEGRPRERFVYLSWGTGEPRGFAMFRRAKLMLADVPADVLREAARLGRLVVRVGLTDGKGDPLCAAVRPPVVRWSID